MQALLDTMTRERAGRVPKASPSVSPSFHENQRGRASARGLSRARGHGVVRVDHVVEADRISLGSALTHLLPVELARASSRVLFQPHSHWSRCSSSPVVTNRGVSSSSRALLRVNSHDLTGANRSVVHSATRQHFSQALADVVHFDHHLSSVSGLVGIDPNENGLTYEAQPLPPDGKAYD